MAHPDCAPPGRRRVTSTDRPVTATVRQVAADAAPRRLHRIVVVGGGAGGLELATRLGDKLGKRGTGARHAGREGAHAFLEAAPARARRRQHGPRRVRDRTTSRSRTGTISATGSARWSGSTARGARCTVAPFIDEDGDRDRRSARSATTRWCIAVGSLTNDFGTPGVKEHAIALETPAQAERVSPPPGQRVHPRARAGRAAAPGAAARRDHRRRRDRRRARRRAAQHDAYAGVVRPRPHRPREGHPAHPDRSRPIASCRRCRSGCPRRRRSCSRSSACTCGPRARVAEVLPHGVRLASGEVIPAELVVWAAGVKAPDFLKDLEGLETNRINQLVVLPTLQTTRDENIFAIGDCAACPWLGQAKASRSAARAVGAPAGVAHGEADPQSSRRQAARRVALPRLRLARVARRVLDRRQPDGRARRRATCGSRAISRG